MKPVNPHLIRVIVVSETTGFLLKGHHSTVFFCCMSWIPTVSALYCFRLESLTSSPTWLVADNRGITPPPPLPLHLPENGHKQPLILIFYYYYCCALGCFLCVLHSSNSVYINPHNNYDSFLFRPCRSQVEQKRGGRKFGWDALMMLFFYLLFI